MVVLVAALVGITIALPWPVVILSTALWVPALGRRIGSVAALALSTIVALWAILLTLTLAHASGIPMVDAVSAIFGVLGIAAIIVTPPPPTPGGRLARALPLMPALLGPLVWGCAQFTTVFQPAFARLGWVMRNDAVSNLIYARMTIGQNGIATGPLSNPVPLPPALVALTAVTGRPPLSSGSLLAHDLTAMTLTWGALAMLGCLFAGLICASIVRAARGARWTVLFAAGFGSVMPLTWLFNGYPIEYGFLNVPLALLVLFGAILLYFSAPGSPWTIFTGMTVAATVLLAVWSPLTVVPVALAIAAAAPAIVARRFSPRVPFVAAIVGTVLAAVYAGLVALPVFIGQKAALAGLGGIYNPGKWFLFVLVAAAVTAAVLLFRRVVARETLGIVLMAAGLLGGLGVLLFVSRRSPDPWIYYPIKFAWMGGLVLLIVIAGLVLALVGRLRLRALRAVGLALSAGFLVFLLLWQPFIQPGFVSMNPVDRLVRGGSADPTFSKVDEKMLELSQESRPTILWRSGVAHENAVNLYLIQVNAAFRPEKRELSRLASISYTDRSTKMLCRIGEQMGPGLVVRTRSTTLQHSLDVTCPSTTIRLATEP